MTKTLALLLPLAFATTGCEEISIENAPCPCAEGWVCCEGTDICVSEAAMCELDVGPTPDADPTSPDAAPDPGEPDAAMPAPAAFTVFLNFEGATVTPGPDDASINRSSVAPDTSEVPAFSAAPFSTTKTRDEIIGDIRDGVADLFAPYDVGVVTARPAGGDYVMALVGGKPRDLGLPDGVGAVAPFSCDLVPRAIVYVFSDRIGAADYDDQLARASAWIAQEVGHAYGLEHVDFCNDVMNFAPASCGPASFTDFDADCSGGSCTCGGGPTQNAHDLLLTRLGPS